jgi:hypothetical protein
MQIGATKKGADITGAENTAWSSDMVLKLLNLPYDGTPSTTVISRTPSSASRNVQCTGTEAATNSVHAQPSNIQKVVNPGVRATRAVDPPAVATGPVGDGQLVVPTGGGGSATIVNLDLTIPQESGGQTDNWHHLWVRS